MNRKRYEIHDSGPSYTTYGGWFRQKTTPVELAQWRKHYVSSDGVKGKIPTGKPLVYLGEAPHKWGKMLALLRDNETGQVYLYEADKLGVPTKAVEAAQ